MQQETFCIMNMFGFFISEIRRKPSRYASALQRIQPRICYTSLRWKGKLESDISRNFGGIPLISKVTRFSVTRSPPSHGGSTGPKTFEFNTSRLVERHLRHLVVILSSSRFLFFCFLFFFLGTRVWAPIPHPRYQNPAGYVAAEVLSLPFHWNLESSNLQSGISNLASIVKIMCINICLCLASRFSWRNFFNSEVIVSALSRHFI